MIKENCSEKLDQVDHVTIQVADIEKSVQWYCTSFACKPCLQTKTFALLEFSNIKVALTLPSQEPNHLAFIRSNAAEFGELRKRSDGSMGTYLSDPTGNIVELITSR
ncbi:MAG: VOC family protein [Deltaproteobacteria bacterium]|nr:VOC family protein [Deltaproteobacteria bacterium]